MIIYFSLSSVIWFGLRSLTGPVGFREHSQQGSTHPQSNRVKHILEPTWLHKWLKMVDSKLWVDTWSSVS